MSNRSVMFIENSFLYLGIFLFIGRKCRATYLQENFSTTKTKASLDNNFSVTFIVLHLKLCAWRKILYNTYKEILL